jgi:predicted RNase H-like nuclease (RuvC/YqgF family)|tara:strand:- start:349 stop:489 length:141 start_codon:yes stop_codon:yes gene_type:complete
MKILKSIIELESENEELKKLLKECNDEANEYHTKLCNLHNDIRNDK